MTDMEALDRLMVPPTEAGTDSADFVQQFAGCLAGIADRLSEDEVECLAQAGQRLYQTALGEYLALENSVADG